MSFPSLAHLCLQERSVSTGVGTSKRKADPAALVVRGEGPAKRVAADVRSDAEKEYNEWLKSTTNDTESEATLKRVLTLLSTEGEARRGSGEAGERNLREIAITRLLVANGLIRFNYGLEPFFGDKSPQRQSIGRDATSVDTSNWGALVWVSSRMDADDEFASRHAMVAMRHPHNDRVTLIDSNGEEGKHAKRVQSLSAGGIDVASTKPVQGNVQETGLWTEGQVLGRFKGWCTLWSLCVCELVALGGLTLDGVLWLLNPSNDHLERLLWIVRESAIRNFHRALTWLRNKDASGVECRMLQKLPLPNEGPSEGGEF